MSLALFDTSDHALAVDIADLQPRGFRDTQACGVGCHQNGAMLEAADRFEKLADLLLTEDDRQLARLSSTWGSRRLPVAFERDVVQEAQRCRGHHQRAG